MKWLCFLFFTLTIVGSIHANQQQPGVDLMGLIQLIFQMIMNLFKPPKQNNIAGSIPKFPSGGSTLTFPGGSGSFPTSSSSSSSKTTESTSSDISDFPGADEFLNS